MKEHKNLQPDSEMMILGGLLLNPARLPDVQKELEPESFNQKRFRALYEAILKLAERGDPIEVPALVDVLSHNGGLEKVGGKDYIFDLANAVSTSASLDFHIQTVREAAFSRSFQVLLLKGLDSLKEGNPVEEALSLVASGIEELRERRKQTEGQYFNADDLLAKEYKAAWVIGKGILPVGGGLILAGESGIGKSILRTEIAIHLAMGWSLFELPVPQPRNVLIIQFENPEPTEQYRLKQMMTAFQIKSLPNIKFLNQANRFDLKAKKERQRALGLIKDSGANIIIWDPLSSLHEGNENDNIQMRTVLDTITEIDRKTGASSIVLHHWGKPNEDRAEEYRLRGATSIRDWADTVIQMTRKKHKNKILHYLTFTKIRNGPEHRPILIQADKEHFTHSVVEEDNLVNPEKVAETLYDLGGEVETQAKLKEALMEEMGCGDKTAKLAIKNAVNKTVKEFDTGAKSKGYYLIEGS